MRTGGGSGGASSAAAGAGESAGDGAGEGVVDPPSLKLTLFLSLIVGRIGVPAGDCELDADAAAAAWMADAGTGGGGIAALAAALGLAGIEMRRPTAGVPEDGPAAGAGGGRKDDGSGALALVLRTASVVSHSETVDGQQDQVSFRTQSMLERQRAALTLVKVGPELFCHLSDRRLRLVVDERVGRDLVDIVSELEPVRVLAVLELGLDGREVHRVLDHRKVAAERYQSGQTG